MARISQVICRVWIIIFGLILHVNLIYFAAVECRSCLDQIAELQLCYVIRLQRLLHLVPSCEEEPSYLERILSEESRVKIQTGLTFGRSSVIVYCLFLMYLEVIAQMADHMQALYEAFMGL